MQTSVTAALSRALGYVIEPSSATIVSTLPILASMDFCTCTAPCLSARARGPRQHISIKTGRTLMPIKLLNLDQFVRLIVDNYDNVDMDTRAILPLVRIYWPA